MVPAALVPLYLEHVEALWQSWCSLLQQQGFDALLIAAGGEQMRFQDDQAYPFQANPWFLAWLPLPRSPGSYLWIDTRRARPHLYCHQPRDIWHKLEPLQDDAIEAAFEVTLIDSPEGLEQRLPNATRVAFLGPAGECPLATAVCNSQPLLHALDYRRAIKSPYEVACLRLATARAVDGQRVVAAGFEAGLSEFELHLAYLGASEQLEQELPYANIIGYNRNAAVLHYTQKERQPPRQRLSLLIDAGACEAGYAADISRTYASGARPEFRALLAGMERLQQRVVADIRVGMSFVDLHRAAHRYLADLLSEASLIRCSAERALERGLTRLFLPHGLGHLLGLQVHDRGGWLANPGGEQRPPPPEHPFLRLTRAIEAGQVFTIEPGLYFIPALLAEARRDDRASLLDWALIDHLTPCGGIRIEDNIHVTTAGVENLTRNAFAEGMDAGA